MHFWNCQNHEEENSNIQHLLLGAYSSKVIDIWNKISRLIVRTSNNGYDKVDNRLDSFFPRFTCLETTDIVPTT